MSRTRSLLSRGTNYCAYSKKRSVWFNNSHRGIKLKEENAPISFIGLFVLHKICVSQLKRILKGSTFILINESEQYLAASLKWDQISVLVCFMANLASLIRVSYRLHVKKKVWQSLATFPISFPQGANKSMSLFLANCEAKLKSSLLSFMQTVTWNNTSFVENSLDFIMGVRHVKWVMITWSYQVHKQIECWELFFTEVLLPWIDPPPISDWSKTDFLFFFF